MTLIIVDQDRMVADSYATVVDTHAIQVMEGFPKLFALPFRFDLDEDRFSYTRLGFVGNAHAFHSFYEWLLAETAGQDVVLIETLRLAHKFMGGPIFQLVIPFPGGAVTMQYGGRTEMELEYHFGSILGFGGDYITKVPTGTEYRSWDRIFQEALTGGWLPGRDYHYLDHNTNVDTAAPSKGQLESKVTQVDLL